ncbi:hypothetical protein HYALB_00008061 [Hymenoscyphus albidus]|uniref:Uncharacterized protein n=1 Tax=Hymenoscyphus albidus TaxID=595503 RepID=A0A9N9LMM8_9HELO|nr:hypothetical protein HYALB_00008061 [Hymenoscyphus albidus]
MSSTLLAMQLAKSRYPPNTAIPLQVIHEECHGSLKGTFSPERHKNGESSKNNSTEANTSTPDTETLNMSQDSPRESGEDTSHGGTPPTMTTVSPIQDSAGKSTLNPTSAEFIPAEYVPKRAELMSADRLDMAYRAQKEVLQMDCIAAYQRDNSWQQHEIASLKSAMRMESVIGVRKRLNPAVKEFVPSMERMCPLNGFSQKRLDNLHARIVVLEQESMRLRCERGMFLSFGRMKCFG